ncbi:hypothetical protein QYF61_012548 [Mycteria americana]|uniref:Uncharacterized protein n=1 Tax=Mycteria americana TaxID=33587 RepID=A0AAN7MY17_MYCAM|nr:hypothetical protein QYF61_012548 [Mycteria americana]
MTSLALVTIRSSIASPRAGLSNTWIKKLSSMHSRSLLDCLQLAVLLFQQMSGWLKSPSRTRACEFVYRQRPISAQQSCMVGRVTTMTQRNSLSHFWYQQRPISARQSRVVGRVTTMTERNRLASNFINW